MMADFCLLLTCSYGTFATGGCDGFVNVWDGNNKKRLYQVHDWTAVILHLKAGDLQLLFNVFCSIQSIQQALLLFRSAEMGDCWLSHQVTLSKKMRSRKIHLSLSHTHTHPTSI